jgi:hypothetical protein
MTSLVILVPQCLWGESCCVALDRKRVVCPEEKRMSGSKFCGGALPIDVLRFIFRFLSSKEIATLDNAMTNRNDREVFLLALSGTESRMIFSSNKEKSESEVRWCLSRGVVFHNLWIHHDHPPYLSQLILRNAQRITDLDLCLDQMSSQLTSAICQCSNLKSLLFMGCQIVDSEMNICFRELTKLNDIAIYSAPRLTAASIRSLVQHCQGLERLTFNDVPCVSDNELREILEGLPHLRSLFLTNVNITDRSMTLIAQTNAIDENYEIVQWDNCPRVTWDGKLSYLRQLHLSQLFSHNQKLQLSGLKGFAKVIPFRSQFPIEQFISMGFFTRTQEIISSIDQHLRLVRKITYFSSRQSLKVFELIAKLSTEVDWDGAAIDEDWIRMIPCLIQILFLLERVPEMLCRLGERCVA